MKTLTQAELKKLLHYDPTTGLFRWKVASSNRVSVGKVAGYKNTYGYIEIRINKILYLRHRLAWLYVYGYFPEFDIDHRNGVPGDDWIANLRHVSSTCNMQNLKVYTSNKSGFPGVCWDKTNRKWKAQMAVNKQHMFIGYFPTALEAALARFTVEVQCPQWTCNHRSKLAQAIKKAWPEFNPTP